MTEKKAVSRGIRGLKAMPILLKFGGVLATMLVATVALAATGALPKSALASSPLAVFVTNWPSTQAVSQSGNWNVGISGTPAVSQSGSWTVGLGSTDAANLAKLGSLSYDSNDNLKVTGSVSATQSGSWTTALDSTDSGYLSKLNGLSFSSGALNVNVTNPSTAGGTVRRFDLITTSTTITGGSYIETAPVDTSSCRTMYVALEFSPAGQVQASLVSLDSAGAGFAFVPGTPLGGSTDNATGLYWFPLTYNGSAGGLAFQWPSVRVLLNSPYDESVQWAALYCAT